MSRMRISEWPPLLAAEMSDSIKNCSYKTSLANILKLLINIRKKRCTCHAIYYFMWHAMPHKIINFNMTSNDKYYIEKNEWAHVPPGKDSQLDDSSLLRSTGFRRGKILHLCDSSSFLFGLEAEF